MKINYRIILLLVLILALQVVLRLPFLDVPFERDEGAYGYMAQRIISGDLIYKDAMDHKPPLVYFTYALPIKLFGNSIQAIRVPTLIYCMISTVFVFLITRLWLGGMAGIFSALLYSLFSGGLLVQGFTSNTETFMVLPMLISLYLFMLYLKNKNPMFLLSSGIFSGAAVLFKQVSIVNFAFLLVFLYLNQRQVLKSKIRSTMIFLAGFLIMPAVFLVYFLALGILPEVYYCIFKWNAEYLAVVSSTQSTLSRMTTGFAIIKDQMLFENAPIWIFSICAFIYIAKDDLKNENILIAFWTFASFVCVFISGLFFPHYFIQIIPGLCLLSSYAAYRFVKNANFVSAVLVIALLIFIFIQIFNFEYGLYTKSNGDDISSRAYGTVAFPVSRIIAQKLMPVLKNSDNILVWSANPEIYYYLGKKSPTEYFNYLYWMRSEKIDKKIAEEVERAKPLYIIRTDYSLPNSKLYAYVQKYYFPYMKVWKYVVFKLR